jgi:hypothetical protein
MALPTTSEALKSVAGRKEKLNPYYGNLRRDVLGNPELNATQRQGFLTQLAQAYRGDSATAGTDEYASLTAGFEESYRKSLTDIVATNEQRRKQIEEQAKLIREGVNTRAQTTATRQVAQYFGAVQAQQNVNFSLPPGSGRAPIVGGAPAAPSSAQMVGTARSVNRAY